MLPEIRFTADELTSGTPTQATVESASQQLRVSGVLLLHDLFPKRLLCKLQDEFAASYSGYLKDKEHSDALSVGPRRTMVTVTLAGPFGDPSVYANSLLYPIVEAVLGPNCLLNSFGVVVSLPHAAQQRTHRDHPGLFRNPGLDSIAPCYALSLLVPLVEISEHNGPTAVWPGSHRSFGSNAQEENPDQSPMDLGSALMIDYRLLHRGGANHTSAPRPIIYCSYGRPWFRDEVNFKKQPPLLVGQEAHESVPDYCRQFLSEARVINFDNPSI